MATKKVKVGTQLPADLHRRLKIAAARDCRSMDELITTALEDFLTRRKGRSIYSRLDAIEQALTKK